jgi:Zn-dependent peptidase ImmA (M78 family)
MAKSVTAPTSPKVLAWARRSACVSIEDAAKAAAVTVERVQAWESGDDQPTLGMLRSLAAKYKRPLGVMLLREPPLDFQALSDFRRTSGAGAPIHPKVAFEIRMAYERREIALDMLTEADDLPTAFELRLAGDDHVEDAGDQIRAYFEVSHTEQLEWARRGHAFDKWRAKIEAKGVLVFVMGGPHGPLVRQVRGFAIPADRLPVVAVNGRDKTNGRTFTLLHECVHLALGQAVVENDTTSYQRLPQADRAIEKFCNAVAAAALMPKAELSEAAKRLGKGPSSGWADNEVQMVAERFGVSREAMLVRAVGLGFASPRFYLSKRAQFAAEYARMDQPSGEKAPIPHHTTMVGRYGRPFARSVLNGYQERRITMNDAAAYLNVQAKHIDYIARQAYREA